MKNFMEYLMQSRPLGMKRKCWLKIFLCTIRVGDSNRAGVLAIKEVTRILNEFDTIIV